ncbi:MAG: metalloregulator ArsR/SmtB family transcription factor [Gammaproteobacteria bacterium]
MLTPSQLFKCLSDETRLRCVTLLQREGSLCVCELTEALALSQPKISRHLAQLRQCGVLTDSREGQWVFYRINPDLPDWAFALLRETVNATAAESPFRSDTARLHEAAQRPERNICR